MKPICRIIVLFGNTPLLGQELGNIDVLDSLKQSGCEVLFLIRRGWTEDTIQPELNKRGLHWETVPYLEAIRRGKSPLVWWNNVKGIVGGSLRLLYWRFKFKATHIHAANPQAILNFLPALLLLRTPIIYRMGDQVVDHHWLWRMVWVFTRLRVSRFVTLNNYIAGLLVGSGVPASKIVKLSNISPLRSSPQPTEQRTYLANGLCTFVYFGQIVEHKGVGLLVEAAISRCQESGGCRFLLAGDYSWNNKFADDLIARVAQLGLSSRIVFLGYVSDIAGLLSESDVHVCPSTWEEAFGNVVIEAKQQAVLSVIFASGGLTELVRHGEDGWICPGKTVDNLCDAFSFYEGNPSAIPEQGSAARQSLPALGEGKFASDWLGLYESVR